MVAIGNNPICPANLFPDWTAWHWSANWPTGEELPRVANNLLDGVAFLYRTADEARRHTRIGGTCFLIGHPVVVDGKASGRYVPYMVSNRHVVWNSGCPVVRLNRRDGGAPDVIEKEANDWIVHPGGDDLAVTCVFGELLLGIHKVMQAPIQRLVTEQMAEEYEIGIGDDVLMMGRFVNHQGRVHNEPAIRFGNISAPVQPIWNKAIQRDQDSYAVEMRSRTGFSGSPVSVYRAANSALTDVKVTRFDGLVLGVNWGHILDEEGENTWLNGVVPAWKILETLETAELKKAQQKATEAFVALNKRDGVELAAEFSPASDENPNHRGDFNRLLGAAAKTQKPAD